MTMKMEGRVAPSLWTVLCQAACVLLTCRRERKTRILTQELHVSNLIVKDTGAVPWRKKKGLMTRVLSRKGTMEFMHGRCE